MDFGPGFTALLFSFAAIWLTGIVLAFVNLFLIGSIKTTATRFLEINIIIFVIYTVSGLALFCGVFNQSETIVVPIFGVPILSISHFFYLFRVRQKLRKQKVDENKIDGESKKLITASNNRRIITPKLIAVGLVIVVGIIICFASFYVQNNSPQPDPLIGWKELGSMGWNGLASPGDHLPPLSKAITDDYQDFINKLPIRKDHANHSESYWIDEVSVFEDGTGQHAVVIQIPLDGTWWKHILIYDKNNVRIKTIKFASGHYAC